MLFYRIAHPDITATNGQPRGPYTAATRHFEYDSPERQFLDTMSDAHMGGTHPTCLIEYGHHNKDWFCGFTSLDQLEEWFDGYLDGLLDLGFQIYTYDLPAERIQHFDGARQAIGQISDEYLTDHMQELVTTAH